MAYSKDDKKLTSLHALGDGTLTPISKIKRDYFPFLPSENS